MSTNFYRPRQPITYLHLETNGHDRLSVWVNHGLAGTLTLPSGKASEVILMLVSDTKCLRTHWGGDARGLVVTIIDAALRDNEMIISERGELLIVAEVKLRDGFGATERETE